MQIKQKGILLYEALLYGIAILLFTGMLAGSAVTDVKQGKIAKATAQTAMLGGYISEYNFEIGSYPNSLNDLTQANGQYEYWIKSIPTDPWQNAYVYKKSDDGYVIYSFGPNQTDDGSSVSAVAEGDIGYIGK